jgi:hypothetical protein
LSFKPLADPAVMLETISIPGAISSVTMALMGPFLMLVILPGMTLRALIFIIRFGFLHLHFLQAPKLCKNTADRNGAEHLSDGIRRCWLLAAPRFLRGYVPKLPLRRSFDGKLLLCRGHAASGLALKMRSSSSLPGVSLDF